MLSYGYRHPGGVIAAPLETGVNVAAATVQVLLTAQEEARQDLKRSQQISVLNSGYYVDYIYTLYIIVSDNFTCGLCSGREKVGRVERSN